MKKIAVEQDWSKWAGQVACDCFENILQLPGRSHIGCIYYWKLLKWS